ncbi:hypothetical protein IEO21_04319 [Rhodonia placenta]|uniref:Uncharacterized protein n=1 Tax=Rhodonia placenta TaxID=104341 RepID=A0A8H7U3A7_9APHY|nr:hypothetical protein IEO21_04319 [Postia placenta]
MNETAVRAAASLLAENGLAVPAPLEMAVLCAAEGEGKQFMSALDRLRREGSRGPQAGDVCERPPADGSLLRQGARREACRQRVLASLSRLADFTCRPEAGTVECLRWATIVQHCCPSKLQRI